MKKKMLLLMIIVFVGCYSSDSEYYDTLFKNSNLCVQQFYASTDVSHEMTRTTISDLDGRSVIWDRSDTVAIFLGSSSCAKYVVKEGCAGKNRTILVPFDKEIVETNIDEYSSSIEKFYYKEDGSSGKISSNVAYYPYDKFLGCTEENGKFLLNVIIPERQQVKINSFGDNCLPIAAVSQSLQDNNLIFKNVMGLVKLSLTGDVTIREISITGNNKEKLAGNAIVTCSASEAPVISYLDNSTDTIKLILQNDLNLDIDKSVSLYIVMPPALYPNGISVKYHISNNTIVKVYDKELDLHRSEIFPIRHHISKDIIISEVNKPAISWIDDDFTGVSNDGVVTNTYQKVHDFCLEKEIPLDFAYIPSSVSASLWIPKGKVSVAQKWQNEGFRFLMHPFHNQGWYNYDATHPHDITKVEASIIDCYESFERYGLHAPKILVWPGNSYIFEDNLELAKRYYDCAITSTYNNTNHLAETGRYFINRLSFQALSKGILTKTQFKQRIKEAIDANDWIIFASHIHSIIDTDVPDETSFSTANVFEILEYANSLCRMRHTEDVWNERKTMWDIMEDKSQ